MALDRSAVDHVLPIIGEAQIGQGFQNCSPHPLIGPAPKDGEAILAAASTSPEHGKLTLSSFNYGLSPIHFPGTVTDLFTIIPR